MYTYSNDAISGQESVFKAWTRKHVLLPDSNFKMFWNIVVIILLIYTAIYVPYDVSFNDKESKGAKNFSYSIDILFAIDICINFMSGYEDTSEGKIITDVNKIASNYLKSWFFPDFVACIPFNLFQFNKINENAGKHATSARLVRLARLPRLYRLIRIVRMLKMIKIMKNSAFLNNLTERLGDASRLRLLKMLGMIIYMVHIVSCLWHMMANFNGFPFNCWVQMNNIRD